ncbi:cell division protein ZapA [Sphingobium subterraneum]|uniref:Cell division protein ZapA n=1 Tax=Sphingobium subterraneum TaxID=627688 RepID=A0A841IVI4_9SPHN|nr:cell division protein ZapA [Sphingobium subterraneum]MBB6122677.1 cell division protein ZapA [Sphingobium subterraneum]
MAEVQISVGGRQYAMHCRDGDEIHLSRLAELVDTKVASARQASPGLTEVRQLLFAAILLADELHDEKSRARGEQSSLDLRPVDSDGEDALAARLNHMAERIEALAGQLAG